MPDDTTTLPVAPATDPTNIPTAGATLTAATPQTPAAPPAPARPDGVSDTEWNALGDPGKAALIREREAAARAAADLAALRKEIEDANKTAEQKAADDLREARALAEQNAAKALRYEIAAEQGIPLALAPRLSGTTREELLADAESLKNLIPAGATPPRTPAPDPGQGPRPDGPQSEDDQTYEALFGPQTRK